MPLIAIGTSTVVPAADRVCACLYVEHSGVRLLLDCGPGAAHHLARFGVPWPTLTHVALTHFHTDHVGGLPALFFALRHALEAPRTAPLGVIGPRGTRRLFQRLADALGEYLVEPGFPLRFVELDAGDEGGAGDVACDLPGGLRLRARATRHTEASLAYRLDDAAGAGLLGYTGDTGPDPSLGDFMAGVHTLVAECSLPDDRAMDTHLTPSSLAAIARRAAPRRLIATHIYPALLQQDVARLIRAAGWDGEVVVAEDGMRWDVG
jgi:ribonuclease BN (tRNA processing enzyme)